MKIKEFVFGKFNYKYYLIHEDRKSLGLTVRPNMSLVLRVPRTCKQSRINIFLQKKWLWFDKQINYFKKYQKSFYEKEFISGESHLYLGRQYKLKVKKSLTEEIIVDKKTITIKTVSLIGNGFHNKQILDNWYGEQVDKIFSKRYLVIQKNFNYSFVPKLVIRKMPKRWGSFLTKKQVVLNPELIKAPVDCIDYVITHELCHMKYRNHSKEFYIFLKSKFPNWEKIKEKLELLMS